MFKYFVQWFLKLLFKDVAPVGAKICAENQIELRTTNVMRKCSKKLPENHMKDGKNRDDAQNIE